MTAIVVPLFVLYGAMLVLYQRSNREFKRFESTYRSPLYSHVSETLAGLSTVKAYGTETQFVLRQRYLMDESNTPAYMRLGAAIWIGIRMEVLSTLLTLVLCILGVTSAIAGAQIGLALTYSTGITGLLNLLLISTTQLETEFNSVERLTVYCDQLPQEKPAHIDGDPDVAAWPSQGKISFKNITLSYPSRPDVLILKDLSLEVNPGEKVGVIGRTGSGKSTLMTALFRIVELKSGSIHIDDQGTFC
jgi:ATP-binding cassette, subfamily C (CFTR/MRP), member 1